MSENRRFDQDRLQNYHKSVRVFGIRKEKFLEFEFTVGSKELVIELVMPYPAFKEFCDVNHVAEIVCDVSIRVAFNRLSGGNQHKENIIQLGEFR